ncbi:MAG TPA: PEP-CTERM sorting domain-containing protein [Fimbriimonadaceae bacterium]|nr:PEP-CTERM sorting domain-containing protein [Fimbriimonadaceae bacterium]
MSALINKTSAKVLAIAGLAIGISSLGFASGDNTSVVNTINTQNAVNNTAVSPSNFTSRNHGGGHGTTGGDGGHTTGGGGNNGGTCVPEPMSMLALGIGAGMVFLKKRAKKA